MSVAVGTGIAIGVAAGTATAGVVSAHMQSNAAKEGAKVNADAQTHAADLTTQSANHAADLQSKSAADALAFTKQQAEQTQANFNATQRANYDQWAASARRLGTLGQAVGLAPREIPAYQDAPTVGQPGQPGQAPAANAGQGGDYQAFFNQLTGGKPLDQNGLMALEPQLTAAGWRISPGNQTDGSVSKVQTPAGEWVRVLNGDTKVASPTVWIPQNGAGGAQPPRLSTLSSALTGNAPSGPAYRQPAVTGNLAMPTPGTLADYLRLT